MNKTELIEHMAADADILKQQLLEHSPPLSKISVNPSPKVTLLLWLVLALLAKRKELPAQAVTHLLVQRSRLQPLKLYDSAQVKPSKTASTSVNRSLFPHLT